MASHSSEVASSDILVVGGAPTGSNDQPTEKPPQDQFMEEQNEYLEFQEKQDAEAQQTSRARLGRVVGGVHAKELHDDDSHVAARRPLEEVDFDLPLTYTKHFSDGGKDYIMLSFAPGDAENPFNWSATRKAFTVAQLVGMTLFIGLATTAYSSGINSMVSEFGVSNILGQLGLFTFNFTCALAPMFLAPFCELVGRKVVYVGAYACFIIMFVGLSLGQNIATILVCRALLGLFGCVGTILVGGTFDDMYPSHQRARPMALFAYIAILGTVGAPIYAGFIDQALGWRWLQGIQGLSNLPLFAVIIVFFRETRGGVFLKRRAKLLRQRTGDERYCSEEELQASSVGEMLHSSSVKAVRMLATEPVVFAFGLWIAFAWFLTFLFLSVIPITFSEKRGWSEGVAGLPYISLCAGVTLGFVANEWQVRRYLAILADRERAVVPEDRLYGAMWGAVWLPIGLFIYSFTQYGELPWIAPVLALAPIALGIFFVFESCYSFTADCYGANASSAIAGQGLMRNTLGAVSPLFASQFFHNVGSQYAGLVLALVATALTAIPFVMYRYGSALRARSRLAQDMSPAQQQQQQRQRQHEQETVAQDEHSEVVQAKPSYRRSWSSYRGSI